MKKEREPRNAISPRVINMATGISETNRRSSGTNIRRRFHRAPTSGFIRCSIGRRSIFGNISSSRIFPSSICISTKATAPAIAASVAHPVRCRSNPPPRPWTTSSKSFAIPRWPSDRAAHRMKGGEWSYYGKMGTCSQNAETFIQLRSRIETILNVPQRVRLRLFLTCGLAGLLRLSILEMKVI